jgi:hypothetical protein
MGMKYLIIILCMVTSAFAQEVEMTDQQKTATTGLIVTSGLYGASYGLHLDSGDQGQTATQLSAEIDKDFQRVIKLRDRIMQLQSEALEMEDPRASAAMKELIRSEKERLKKIEDRMYKLVPQQIRAEGRAKLFQMGSKAVGYVGHATGVASIVAALFLSDATNASLDANTNPAVEEIQVETPAAQ